MAGEKRLPGRQPASQGEVWAWRHAVAGSDMTSTEKLVLSTLSYHMNTRGECHPSQARLARLCSLCERAVMWALKTASAGGWVAVESRRLSGAKWASKRYTATFPSEVTQDHPWGDFEYIRGVTQDHTNLPSRTSQVNVPCQEEGFSQKVEIEDTHTRGHRADADEIRWGYGA